MKLSLRDVLKRDCVTQTSFAREMGVSKTYVNQLCDIDNYYVIDATLYRVHKKQRFAANDSVVIDDITKYIKK